MNIRDALTKLVLLQAALTITSPVTSTIKRAYKLPPPSQIKLTEFPCFINSVELLPTDFKGSGQMKRVYVVRQQLFIHDSDFDQGCDIALAFEEKLVTAITQHLSLNQTATIVFDIRGQLARLEWAGEGYPGLDYYASLRMTEFRTFADGALT